MDNISSKSISRLLLIGPPGSGKGTQGDLLCQKLGVPHISTGDLLREIVESGSEDASRFKALMASGKFVSDEDIVRIVDERIGRPDAANGYLLDGFPRSVVQAKLFAGTPAGKALELAIAMILPEDLLVERLCGRLTCLQCGASFHEKNRPPKVADVCDNCKSALVRRPDDEPVAIRQRLTVYNEKTKPLIDFYAAQGRLSELPATGSPEDVFDRLCKMLNVS